ncbi:MAG: alanine dehydrogenase [Gammaproteobacteria bacterium RIFCSPHIGHO2_02_FULL_42_13]|nr:MAG: alanine dehydrogenase [Gammaproteobacteria bacterium RIFCSPHIGHO2_02_FULL_42_13]
MRIGVPKEIKNHEYRVGLIPFSVKELIDHGHDVMVQTNAGAGIGFNDDDYRQAGATVVDNAPEIFAKADLIVKVKEPQPNECKMLREGQILFTFLHLAPDPKQTELLLASGCTAIAYETVTDRHGRLPLLLPMSEVAGRLSIQAGAHYLEKANGGRGLLLSGVPGVEAADVLVLGGGIAGTAAIRIATGVGAHVTVLEKSLPRLRELDAEFGSKLNTGVSTHGSVAQYIKHADLVIGAVLVPGGAAPRLVTKDMLKTMHAGSVIVDIAIDQGGCCETSHPTTHEKPTYIVDGVIHYCVANMPGAVPRTSTFALNNATLPFTLKLANLGAKAALLSDPHFLNGLNVCCGRLTNEPVAQALNLKYVKPETVLK